ncbi:MAG TPA: ABC transporter ATP-binding protein [Dongiaceae bacterium]|nr:ABC transporter ATP-binding protein [Dongiaceae bacterium]
MTDRYTTLDQASAQDPPAIRVAGLSHVIGGRKVLDQIDLAVPAGRFTVLLGQNGAGKTTLFSLITRLYAAQSGSIEVAGQDIARHPAAALAQMGIVFQQRALDLELTAAQNLSYHAALHGLSWRETRRRITEELTRVGLLAEAKRRARSFSGGEMRRLEIARALLHRPHLLLCDEATVGLDIRSRTDILADVRNLVQERGLSVLWATHLIDEVRAEDLTIILHRGQIRRVGEAGSIVAEMGVATLQDAFRKLTEGT